MHAFVFTTAALLATLAAAIPADLSPRAAADPTAIWVSVDDDGTPVTTATPKETTVSGTPTLLDAPPHEVTGTVFTVTRDLRLVTSTGSPLPAPTGSKDPSGAFARCFKKKGDDFAPFCDPAPASELFVGNTYYVTWDPDFFRDGNSSLTNTTTNRWRVSIQGTRLNATTGGMGKAAFHKTDTIPAWYGFYTWKIEASMLDHKQPTNVSLLLLASKLDSPDAHEEHRGPTVLLNYKPLEEHHTEAPGRRELYIALPTVLGAILLLVFGTCWWNRKDRQINIGNIMSRSRHGYGAGKARAKRIAGGVRKSFLRMEREKDHAILLRDFDRDEESRGHDGGMIPPPRRRDSDDLGSLAGSPVQGRFENEGGRKNAFRDEIRRQDREWL